MCTFLLYKTPSLSHTTMHRETHNSKCSFHSGATSFDVTWRLWTVFTTTWSPDGAARRDTGEGWRVKLWAEHYTEAKQGRRGTMRASRSGGRNMSRVNWEDNCLHSCVHTVPPKCCKLLQRSYAYAGVSVTKISVNQYNYMHLNTRMHGAWPMLIKTLWYQPSRVAAAMAHCCSDNDISVILVARLKYPSFEATPHTNYSWLN